MPADIAGIGTDSLHEGILGAFDGILYLRRCGSSFIRSLDLAGEGTHPRKQHHAEAVNQFHGRVIQRLAGLSHIVIDHALQSMTVELFHGRARQVLCNGLEDIVRRIAG